MEAGLLVILAFIGAFTTHTISTAIMGVGSTRRLSAVRWGVGREIVTAWVLTFPGCGALAWVAAKALRLLF